jgi:formylglycine-generating enzyme required for sulfatase activity
MNDTAYEASAILRPGLRKLVEVTALQLDCGVDCPLWSAAETARVAKCLAHPTCNRFDSCLTNSATAGVRDNPKTKVREQDGASMLYVPAGSFYRGAPAKHGEDDQRPGGQVPLSAYWIDRTEVTAAQYQKCVDAGACARPGTSPLCNFGKPGRERHPINCVSWPHADTYCKWAGAALPSEAQWEKAARGPGGRLLPWIGFAPSCNKMVWTDPKFGKACGQKSTWAVGSKPGGTSPYGAVDMIGNVWEWVADRYDAKFYAGDAGTDPVNTSSGKQGVLRGGGYGEGKYEDWLASHRFQQPQYKKDETIGFRCALTEQ